MISFVYRCAKPLERRMALGDQMKFEKIVLCNLSHRNIAFCRLHASRCYLRLPPPPLSPPQLLPPPPNPPSLREPLPKCWLCIEPLSRLCFSESKFSEDPPPEERFWLAL